MSQHAADSLTMRWLLVARRLVMMRLGVVLAAMTAAAAAAGCATVPSGGAPQKVKGEGSQVQAYVRPLPPPPPGSNWTAQEVVLGFLHASASYSVDPAAARAYLVRSLRKTWRPGSVTVVAPPTGSDFTKPIPAQASTGHGAAQLIQVTLSGQRIATLSDSGQYLYQPGSSPYTFTLAKVGGIWLINNLPPGVLLLTQADFQDVYQPRNLYFFTTSTSGALIPDPVYVPLQVRNTPPNSSMATGLVNGLLSDHGSWLSGATKTAFPPGTKLLGPVTFHNQTAQVNVGGAAVSRALGQPQVIQNMNAQLRATLTLAGYSPPIARSVNLSINGHSANPVISLDLGVLIRSVIPASAEPLIFRTSANVMSELRLEQGSPVPATVAGQIAPGKISAFAASPEGGQQLAVASQSTSGHGCTLSVGRAGSTTPFLTYQLSQSGGSCTSVSWDNKGSIWAVAGTRIWVLRRQSKQPVAVSPPVVPGISQTGSRILALRMAPDGVRAALLVQTSTGNRIVLAAVSYHGSSVSSSKPAANDNSVAFGPSIAVGSGLRKPVALSWFDPYNLVVLANSAIYEVPLTGAAGQQLGPAPTGADTLTTDGTDLVVGTSQNQIWKSSAKVINWTPPSIPGSGPAFPG